jgi:hypothetical protein
LLRGGKTSRSEVCRGQGQAKIVEEYDSFAFAVAWRSREAAAVEEKCSKAIAAAVEEKGSRTTSAASATTRKV